MNYELKQVLRYLLFGHIIGNKHFPERLLIISKTKHLNKNERKEFEEEYKTLINQNYFIRLKKKTGKGSEWHISLNPEMLEEVKEKVEEE